MSWLDFELDSALIQHTGGAFYPVLHWNHAEAGLVAEVDRLADEFNLTLPWQEREVIFGRGAKSTRANCYVAFTADVCILATRVKWFDRLTNERIADYRPNSYSRLQLLALVRGAEPQQPAMLTFKGSAAGILSKQLTALRRGPISMGRRETGRMLSEHTFWITIHAGVPVSVGQERQVTIIPPQIEMPERGQDVLEWLEERFIGLELADFVNTLAAEIVQWRDADSHVAEQSEGGEEGITDSPAGEPKVEMFHQPWPRVRLQAYAGNQPSGAPFGNLEPDEALFWDRAERLQVDTLPATHLAAKAARQSGLWSDAMGHLETLAADRGVEHRGEDP